MSMATATFGTALPSISVIASIVSTCWVAGGARRNARPGGRGSGASSRDRHPIDVGHRRVDREARPMLWQRRDLTTVAPTRRGERCFMLVERPVI
jgi:hypothetical protein